MPGVAISRLRGQHVSCIVSQFHSWKDTHHTGGSAGFASRTRLTDTNEQAVAARNNEGDPETSVGLPLSCHPSRRR